MALSHILEISALDNTGHEPCFPSFPKVKNIMKDVIVIESTLSFSPQTAVECECIRKGGGLAELED